MPEYIINLDVVVTADSEDEARDALVRSGIKPGALIGEAQVESVERPEEF